MPNSFNEKEIKLTAKDLPVFHVPALPRQNNYFVIVACLFSSMSLEALDLPHVTQQVLETKCKGAFGDNWFSLEDIAALRMQILEHFMGKEFSWQSATPQRKGCSSTNPSSKATNHSCLSMIHVIKAKITMSVNMEKRASEERERKIEEKCQKKGQTCEGKKAVGSSSSKKKNVAKDITSVTSEAEERFFEFKVSLGRRSSKPKIESIAIRNFIFYHSIRYLHPAYFLDRVLLIPIHHIC